MLDANKQALSIPLPADACVHLGDDGRLYVAGLARLQPAVPRASVSQERFRPEFVVRNRLTLSPDALSAFGGCTRVRAHMRRLMAVAARCSRSRSARRGRERRRCCRGRAQAGRVHCLTDSIAVHAAFALLEQKTLPAVAAELDGAFSPAAPPALSAFLHERGVNMRYLLPLARLLKNEAARAYVEQEAVVRAIKHKIRGLWITAHGERHALALACATVQRLEQGELWDGVAASFKPAFRAAVDAVIGGRGSWSWAERVCAAVGVAERSASASGRFIKSVLANHLDQLKLTERTEFVQLPSPLPFERAEALLAAEAKVRDDSAMAPVLLQEVALCHLWSAQAPQAATRGEQAVERLLALHKRAPVDGALLAAAHWYQQRDQKARALELYEEALAAERAKGESVAVADILCAIGAALKADSKYPLALQKYEEALAMQRKLIGAQNAVVATTLHHIGAVQLAQTDATSALKTLEESLNMRRDTLGADHPAVADSYETIGGAHGALGRYTVALQDYEEALRIRRKALGADHDAVAATLAHMGDVQYSTGDNAPALQRYEEALKIRQKALGPEHLDVAVLLGNVAAVLESLGKHGTSLQNYEKALAIQRKQLGGSHHLVAMTLGNMGKVLQSQRKYEEAVQRHNECLTILRATLGPEHHVVATSLNNLAMVYDEMKSFEKALGAYVEALRIKKLALGADHHSVATTLVNIGMVHRNLDQQEPALSAYEEALSIQRKALGPDHHAAAMTLHNLGCVLVTMGNKDRARMAFEEALTIKQKKLGPGHPSTVNTQQWLMRLDLPTA